MCQINFETVLNTQKYSKSGKRFWIGHGHFKTWPKLDQYIDIRVESLWKLIVGILNILYVQKYV